MRVTNLLAAAVSTIALISAGAVPASAQSTQLDQITVEGQNQNIESTETSKEKYEGTILENPAVGIPGVVLTQQDLELINPVDLQDVFNGETSVSVGGSTPVSQKIYVYGIEDSRLAVTVDGALQSNATFHHAGTLLLDPALLKAARVDPAIAPADAGPGALGGSIQFETVDVKDLLDPGKTMGGFVTVAWDTNSEALSTGVSAYAMSNGFEVLGYYKVHDGDDWEAGNGVEQDATAQSLKTALGKFAFEAQSGDRLELSYEWINDDSIRPYRANFGGVIGPGGVINTVTYPNQPYDLERKTFTFTYTDEKPRGWWDPKFVIAYNETSLEAFSDADTSFAEIERWSGKFENKFAISSGNVIAGLDFFHTESFGGYDIFTGTEEDHNIGFYAQARLDLMKNFRTSFGGRIDHQMFTGVDGTDIDNTGFSGNISAEYDLNEIFTLKGGYAHVFGRIPLAEALLNYNAYTYDGLDTYESDNVTAGISAEYKGFTFDANYTLIKMDDAIAYFAERGDPTRSRNFLADIESESFDIAVGYKWATGFVKAQYSNIDVTANDEPIGSTAFYYGTNIGELITLQIVHGFEGTGITVGADAQIALEQDDIIDPSYDPIPAYEVFNAFVEYKPKSTPELTLRAEVNNIFDETYADRATSGQDYLGTSLFDIAPLLEPGRSLYLSARAKF